MKIIKLLLLCFITSTVFSQEVFIKNYQCEVLQFYPDKSSTEMLKYVGPFNINLMQKNDTPIVRISQLHAPFLKLQLTVNPQKIEKLTYLGHTIISYNSINYDSKEKYIIHFVYNLRLELVELGIEDSKSLLVYIIKLKNTFNHGDRYRTTLLVLRSWTMQWRMSNWSQI